MQATGVIADIERDLFRLARIARGLWVSTTIGAPVERAGLAILRRVAECEPTRLSDLAGTLGLDLSTVSRQVRRLEAAGMLARTADATDARASLLDVTAEGRDVLATARRMIHARLRRVLSTWPAEDREDLARLLTRLADDLGPEFSCSSRPLTKEPS